MTNNTLIGIQDEYTATVNSGIARWGVGGGHYYRIMRGAYNRAAKALAKLGYTELQIKAAIRDAADMAKLERTCDDEVLS